MSMLRYGVGLALRRSARAAAVSGLLGSGNTTMGLALRRSARLSHPPQSAALSRFLGTGEPSKTRELEKRFEETKGEFINMYVRMHCKGSHAPDAAKVKVRLEQAIAKFKGEMGHATEERVKQIATEKPMESSGGGHRYRTPQDFVDGVVAPWVFLIMIYSFLNCLFPPGQYPWSPLFSKSFKST